MTGSNIEKFYTHGQQEENSSRTIRRERKQTAHGKGFLKTLDVAFPL